jgi:hypothetical protein
MTMGPEYSVKGLHMSTTVCKSADQIAATLAAAGAKRIYGRAAEVIDLARSNLWR